jgi:chemotaxis protein CheD
MSHAEPPCEVTPQGETIRINLGVGEAHVASTPSHIWTVLGSCVAVVLYVPQLRISAVCHALLPSPTNHSEPCEKSCPRPCKIPHGALGELRYVTCCMSHMIRGLARLGAMPAQMKGAVVGGADVIRWRDPMESVGRKNVDCAMEILEDCNIPVLHSDVGGTQARTLSYETDTGELKVKLSGAGHRTSNLTKRLGSDNRSTRRWP